MRREIGRLKEANIQHRSAIALLRRHKVELKAATRDNEPCTSA
ncbi:hypothetical protein [Variovorax paradoxus]